MWKQTKKEIKEWYSRKFGNGREEIIYNTAAYLVNKYGEFSHTDFDEFTDMVGMDIVGSVKKFETDRLHIYVIVGSNGMNKIYKRELKGVMIQYYFPFNGVWSWDTVFYYQSENGILYGSPAIYRYGKWTNIIQDELKARTWLDVNDKKSKNYVHYADIQEDE